MPELLSVKDLRTGYGSAAVLHAISLRVEPGEVVVLLGANGVGKTTTLRTIAGLVRPWSGSISFLGIPIDRARPERIVRMGMGMVPAPPGVFTDMSVRDNLRVGAFAAGSSAADMPRVLRSFPVLADRLDQRAGSLSGGEQRMLAIARALAGSPRLLVVDEASMGLSPAMTIETLALLDRVRTDGVAILMAEQTIAALDIADRAYVVEKGRITREDAGAALIRTRKELAATYLGAAS